MGDCTKRIAYITIKVMLVVPLETFCLIYLVKSNISRSREKQKKSLYFPHLYYVCACIYLTIMKWHVKVLVLISIIEFPEYIILDTYR